MNNQNDINTSNTQNNNRKNQKYRYFKYILAIIFLIGMIILVIYLPQVSDFIVSKNTNTVNIKEDQIVNITLSYKIGKVSENSQYIQESDTEPKFKFGENIYEIETVLTKKEYDCEASSIV